MFRRMIEPKSGLSVLAPGQVLPGNYRVDRLVSASAFGTVYAATGMAGPCAIKEFPAGQSPHPDEMRARFEDETYVLESCADHPCLPQFLDKFTHEDGHYIVEEIVSGIPLPVLLGRGASGFQLTDSLVWLSLICRALDDLHKHVVVCREIRLANVLITHDWVPLMVGFGSACRAGSVGRPLRFPVEPMCIAPETLLEPQAPADIRADIYCLGCLAYTLLTGSALTPDQILGKQTIAMPSHLLTRFRPDVSQLPAQWLASMDALLGTALQRQPEHRMSDMRPFYERLNGLLASGGDSTRAQSILSKAHARLLVRAKAAPEPAETASAELEKDASQIRWEPESLTFAPLSTRMEPVVQSLTVHTASGKPVRGTVTCVGAGLECVDKGFNGSQFRLRLRVDPKKVADQHGYNRWMRGSLVLRTNSLDQIRIPCWVFVARHDSPILSGEQPLPPIGERY